MKSDTPEWLEQQIYDFKCMRGAKTFEMFATNEGIEYVFDGKVEYIQRWKPMRSTKQKKDKELEKK